MARFQGGNDPFDDRGFNEGGAAEIAAENIAARRRGGRKRVCKFCVENVAAIDYNDASLLRYFLSDRGKVVPRRVSGTCALHQRALVSAIKRGRMIALLPFTTSGK